MELYYQGLSDAGNVRDNNEDYWFAGRLKNDEYLFIVADGMGGHEAGEVASRKAVSIFVRQLEKEEMNTEDGEASTHILETLKRIVMGINETLVREGSHSRKKNGMGTTFSALYIKKNQGYIVHVGDSRIYLFSPSIPHTGNIDTSTAPGPMKRLTRLTDDHSFVGKMLKDGLISEEEARNHPRRNVLFQSIGLKRDITVQTKGPLPIQIGEKYLVCSDGLYGVVPDSKIEEYLEEKSTAQIAGELVKRAKKNGGPDNISVIVISTETDQTINLPETVKIIFSPPKKTRVWFFILLGLLVLLLVLTIYFLVMSIDSHSSPPSPTSLPKSVSPTGNPTGMEALAPGGKIK